MGLMDRLDSRIRSSKSKRNETSEVWTINSQIEENESAINDLVAEIGQYYWNLYADGRFSPAGESVPMFRDIESKLRENGELERRIDERRALGEKERARIVTDLQTIEEIRARRADDSKRQRREDDGEAPPEKRSRAPRAGSAPLSIRAPMQSEVA